MANYDLTYEGSRVQNILDTGDELRDAGYIFRGEATPSTVPGTPTERVAYIGGPGTYTNFGSTLVVPMGGIGVFKYNGTGWNNYAIVPGIGDGGVFDLSAYNAQGSTLATYADLSAALTALNSVPANYKKGGMTMKFILTVSGIYVQYRLQSADFNINPANWVNVEIRINEAVANERDARMAADATLQTNINNEAAARQNTDAALQANINNEATARINELNDFKAAVRQQFDEYQPIVVEGNVINAPDEEDLTSVDQGGTDVLKFKDRNNLYGMGMIIMRRDKTFSEQLTQTNTIYVIRYDFELDDDITIPANCVLEFDGGSISGEHTITGKNTGIEAGLIKIFNTNVTLAGTWNVAEAYPEWFGAKGDNIVDDAVSINLCISFFNKATLTMPVYYTTQTISLKAKSLLESKTKETTIYYKGTTNCILFQTAASESIVRNLTLSGNINTYETDDTVGIKFDDSDSGRGVLLDNLYVAAFNIGVKSIGTLWSSFIINCKFGFCAEQLYLHNSLNINIQGCAFMNPKTSCIDLEGSKNMSFVNCNFGCDYVGANFANILTNCSASFINCNFEHCTPLRKNGTIFIYGGSFVTFDNCRIHRIYRDPEYTDFLVLISFGGNVGVNISFINNYIYDIDYSTTTPRTLLFYPFNNGTVSQHKVTVLNNKYEATGKQNIDITYIDYIGDSNIFREIAVKPIGLKNGLVKANGNVDTNVYLSKNGNFISGNVPEFDGTDGAVKDSGKAASNIP